MKKIHSADASKYKLETIFSPTFQSAAKSVITAGAETDTIVLPAGHSQSSI